MKLIEGIEDLKEDLCQAHIIWGLLGPLPCIVSNHVMSLISDISGSNESNAIDPDEFKGILVDLNGILYRAGLDSYLLPFVYFRSKCQDIFKCNYKTTLSYQDYEIFRKLIKDNSEILLKNLRKNDFLIEALEEIRNRSFRNVLSLIRSKSLSIELKRLIPSITYLTISCCSLGLYELEPNTYALLLGSETQNRSKKNEESRCIEL